MEKKEIKSHIDEIIKRTFKTLKFVYDNQQEKHPNGPNYDKSRLIFPKYSKEKTRLSEQELRFLFVETFNQYCTEHNLPWYYSVETPTNCKYKFSDKGVEIPPEKNDDGQSAMIDLVIHNEKLKRIALMEFKAHNKPKNKFTKDFEKLKGEKSVLTYFIMYVESFNKGTIKSLKSKIENKSDDTVFCCYDLQSDQRIEKEIL